MCDIKIDVLKLGISIHTKNSQAVKKWYVALIIIIIKHGQIIPRHPSLKQLPNQWTVQLPPND